MDLELSSSSRYHRYRSISLLLLLALLLALIPLELPQNNSLPVQPILLNLAAQQPDSQVSVIIQKQGDDNGVETRVESLGGTITKDLHIINAFAADIKARKVPEVARLDGVRWVSFDAPVTRTALPYDCNPCVGSDNLQSAYVKTVGADKVWNESPYLQGQGVGVAVVDSGVNPGQDFYTIMGQNRLYQAPNFQTANPYDANPFDSSGHGTHVAGIIGGNGSFSNGAYAGMAPMVNLISVKVSDLKGKSTTSDMVKGLQWINDNRQALNIKVVNISLNSSTYESYNVSPLDAACEILWFNGVVVVTSAGNGGSKGIMPPANDPFVITVGATDDRGTPDPSDDTLASFSGYGTPDGFAKPDLVAPGTNITSVMSAPNGYLESNHGKNIVGTAYFKMSGTSMSAPVVSGAAALLIQSNPKLNPDQVKYRLKATARPFATTQTAGAGYLNVYAAVHSTTTATANTKTFVSKLLLTGNTQWNSVVWNSVNWSTVNWSTVNWSTVNWSTVNWSTDFWGN